MLYLNMITELIKELAEDPAFVGLGKGVIAGAVLGITGSTLENYDLFLSIILKCFSIVSFAVGIFIALPKVIDICKNWKTYLKGSKRNAKKDI